MAIQAHLHAHLFPQTLQGEWDLNHPTFGIVDADMFGIGYHGVGTGDDAGRQSKVERFVSHGSQDGIVFEVFLQHALIAG